MSFPISPQNIGWYHFAVLAHFVRTAASAFQTSISISYSYYIKKLIIFFIFHFSQSRSLQENSYSRKQTTSFVPPVEIARDKDIPYHLSCRPAKYHSHYSPFACLLAQASSDQKRKPYSHYGLSVSTHKATILSRPIMSYSSLSGNT